MPCASFSASIRCGRSASAGPWQASWTQEQRNQIAGRFGGRLGDLWWLNQADADTGARDTTLVRESTEQLGGASVARLSISCERGDRLEVQVWWRQVDTVAPLASWRIDHDPWRQERWQTFSGTWGEDEWAVLQAFDPASFLHEVNWKAGVGGVLQVRVTSRLSGCGKPASTCAECSAHRCNPRSRYAALIAGNRRSECSDRRRRTQRRRPLVGRR